eukprot:m.292103 g.292103  ORF g.292103 m.292103 type:complete len:69 (+) comp15834_c2_seq2:6684-6890(+)
MLVSRPSVCCSALSKLFPMPSSMVCKSTLIVRPIVLFLLSLYVLVLLFYLFLFRLLELDTSIFPRSQA